MWHPDLFHKQNSLQNTIGLFYQFLKKKKRKEKWEVKGSFRRGSIGVLWMEVMLEPFPFEERWAALETAFNWGPAYSCII